MELSFLSFPILTSVAFPTEPPNNQIHSLVTRYWQSVCQQSSPKDCNVYGKMCAHSLTSAVSNHYTNIDGNLAVVSPVGGACIRYSAASDILISPEIIRKVRVAYELKFWEADAANRRNRGTS
jgi:hypothetical protein